MRITSITNLNYKGLYIDRSNDNGGLWYMEYAPYSWERNNSSRMVPPQELDIYSDELPDNEEIHTPFINKSKKIGRESSKDLLGTEFAYTQNTDFDTKSRSDVVETHSLNFEQSLKIQTLKYTKFLEKKESLKNKLQNFFIDSSNKIESSHNKYAETSKEYDSSIFSSKQKKKTMDFYENKLFYFADSLCKNIQNHIKLEKSITSIKQKKEKNLAILKAIEEAKKNNNFIDISRADSLNQFDELLSAINNITNTGKTKFAEKIIALPHRLMSAIEILKSIKIDITKPQNSQKEILNFIQNTIKKNI